jgi:hypothetical protein
MAALPEYGIGISTFRDFALRKRLKLQFRTEAFNASTSSRGNLPLAASLLQGVSHAYVVEEINVLGRDLVDKVRGLIHEGNVRRIVVKDEHGKTFVEILVTVAALGAILAPLLAAIRPSPRCCEVQPSWWYAASRSLRRADSPYAEEHPKEASKSWLAFGNVSTLSSS